MHTNIEHHIDKPLRVERPIVLVGLMGAGKSTVGRRLASRIGLDFRDSDNEIEEAAACSISDIFEIYGEGTFRDLEMKVMTRLLQSPPMVIATGGGAFIQPTVRELILRHGTSIWLRAELEILIERVSRRNTRPLLMQGDKRNILAKLIDDRYPVYAQAHITVDSGAGSHEAVVEAIIRQLREAA